MIITPPDPASATGYVAEMYRGDLADDGLIYAHTQAMAMNPEAHAAFEQLVRALVGSLGVRLYEAATLGAARAIGSTHCLLAHGRKSLRRGLIDDAGLLAFAAGVGSGYSDREQLVIHYAHRLSTQAADMTDADSQELRDAGFSDREIVDITLAAAARNYFSRALLAFAVPIDTVPGLAPEVAAALSAPRSQPS